MPESWLGRPVDRRAVLAAIGAGAVAAALPSAAGAAAGGSAVPYPGLHAIAAERGLFFGSAIEGPRMTGDPPYAAIVAAECGAATPEGALQWKALQPEPSGFAFARADAAVDYARSNGLWLRGHSVLWYQGVPAWALQELKAPSDYDRLVGPYIEAAAARYAPHLRHWDVVNEPIAPDDGRPDGLRDWRLSALMGDSYVVETFARVRAAAPAVGLYCNDYAVEYDDRASRRRRVALLRALERWLKAGAPIDGFGLQSHLETWRGPSDPKSLRAFLADVADLGLDIVVSELDVREHRFDAPLAVRDRIVADHVARYLDVVLDEPRVRGIVGWGLSDRYSWLLWFHDKRNRGLLYDDALKPKPVRDAIASALRNAPRRSV